MMHKKLVFTFLLSVVLSLSLMACNNMADSNLESRISEESSVANSTSQDSDDDLLSEPEDEPYVMSDSEKYIYPLVYLGSYSWSSADDIDPDFFVSFYISLGSVGAVTTEIIEIDEEMGDIYFNANALEDTIQQYFVFDVPAEYIRQSQYYDADKNAYWTGGIGSTVDEKIISESYEGDILTIHFESSITSTDYNDAWNCIVKIDLSGENYRYISFESDRKKD